MNKKKRKLKKNNQKIINKNMFLLQKYKKEIKIKQEIKEIMQEYQKLEHLQHNTKEGFEVKISRLEAKRRQTYKINPSKEGGKKRDRLLNEYIKPKNSVRIKQKYYKTYSLK